MVTARRIVVVAAVSAIAALLAPLPAGASPVAPKAGAGGAAPSGGGGSAVTADFDADGFDDLAVAAPGEDVGDVADAGNATVAYGSPTGLATTGATVLRQGLGGVAGTPEAGDWFGAAVAAGDFDGDGFDDLAVGASQEDAGTVVDSGNLVVARGSAGGVRPLGSRTLRQGGGAVGGVAEVDDWFGETLAAGDVDGDGYDDLAVAAPFEAVGTIAQAGNVTLLFGSPAGLASSRSRPPVVLRQGLNGLVGAAEPGDVFGIRLVVADRDGDGYDDVVVGAPGEDVGSVQDAGNVTIVPGSPTGPDLGRDRVVNAGTTACGCAQKGANFGWTLAAGDVNADGLADVAVGAPLWDTAVAEDAGNVTVVFGTAEGITPSQALDQSSFGLAAEPDDQLTWNVAIGDLDGDGADELVLGASSEDVGSVVDAGFVTVVAGAGAEFPGGSRSFHQASFGGATEAGDLFAHALVVGDYDGDGFGDLAASAVGEDVAAAVDAGNVTVAFGGTAGLATAGARPYHQGSFGGAAEAGDLFGLNMG